MKRALLSVVLLIAAAGVLLLQTAPPPPKLAAIMPSGALLYLEAQDFGRLLREWDASKVKADWLSSTNHEVFSHSNLFIKLQGVYDEYGAAAGFLPGLKSVSEIAGTESALALYEIHDVQFLYVTRIADADLMKSQLWTVRDKFEQRQAGGAAFYLRSDPASHRTVAFAFTNGYLLLATRDDLIAQALELLAGGKGPALESDRWYRESTAAAARPGELRLVMNLESLEKSTYFRSYWIQRNASVVKRYWAGIADVQQSEDAITENRIFLRAPEAAESGASNGATASGEAVSNLVTLVPPQAGLYKVSPIVDPNAVATLIVQKLIAPEPSAFGNEREAPLAASPDAVAGSEADLETRIDQQPLPTGAGIPDSIAALRELAANAAGRAVLMLQSSADAATFIRTPAVIVLDGAQDWNRDAVKHGLSVAAGDLWTTSQLGAGWVSGGDQMDRLNGLGSLAFAIRGRLLFLGNDVPLLTAVVNRPVGTASAATLTYAAGFRHLQERAGFERITAALEFGKSADDHAPPFYSGNIASLSRVLSPIGEIDIRERDRGGSMLQTVTYRFARVP